MYRRLAQLLLATTALIVGTASPAFAIGKYGMPEPGSLKTEMPLPYQPGEIGVDQAMLGQSLPLDAVFTDDTGAQVRLGDYFNKGRPVLLNLGYYECPMLCGLMNQSMVKTLKGVPFDIGTEFDVVNISINPGEVWPLARDKKKSYLRELGTPGKAVGWHLLVGEPASIDAVTRAVGYKYKKVDREYAHPAVLILVGSSGKVTHYLDALQVDSETMRLALIESSGLKLGSLWDKAFVTCFDRDPHTGKYTKLAVGAMQVGGLLFVLGFGAIMVPLWWKSLRQSNAKQNDPPAAPKGSGTAGPAVPV